MARARPSLASASVRAMMTNCGSVRASTAALMRSTISSGGNQFLAGPVAAALGAHLVLNVHGCRAGLDHLADGARNVEGSAPAGVDIDQQRQRGGVGDAPDIGQHIFHGADAEVRNAERIGRHASAGEINGAETRRLGQARRVGIDGAHHLQRLLCRERRAKARSRRPVHADRPPCVFLWRIITGFSHGFPASHFRNRAARCDNHPVGAFPARNGSARRRNITMKRLFICTGLLLAATTLFAQPKPPAGPPEPAGHGVGDHRRQGHHHHL